MEWPRFIADLLGRASRELEAVLDGLSVDDLNRQPRPDSNSIGWLAWHLTRSFDRALGDFTAAEPVWTRDGWHQRFGRPADPGETGFHHTAEEAAAFRSPDGETLLAYHRAVIAELRDYLGGLSEAELDRAVDSPTLGETRPLSGRLEGIINDGFEHVGQAAYVRGLLKGRGLTAR